MFERLFCAIFGHKYFVERKLSEHARKVGCLQCDRKWAMHDPTKSFLPWDEEFEAFYGRNGPLSEILGKGKSS